MSLFEYKGSDAYQLVLDALDLMIYSYHGLDDALGSAYQANGFSLPMIIGTLWGTEEEAGLLSGESEQAARDKIEAKGWTVLSAADLGYEDADVDHNGTFQGKRSNSKMRRQTCLPSMMRMATSARYHSRFAERPERWTIW